MIIGGLQKFSLIDYPGKISAVLFTQGCSFRCPFCHNPELVIPDKFGATILTENVLTFLNSRKSRLDGVVISGGEPTIQEDLLDFVQKVKQMNFLIKIDTNGSRPEILKKIIDRQLADYIAMDIKAPFHKYQRHTGAEVREEKIRQSIGLIINSDIDYEFRTTVVKEQLSLEDIFSIGRTIRGAKRYILQKFAPNKTLDSSFSRATTYTDDEFEIFCQKLKPFAAECCWR